MVTAVSAGRMATAGLSTGTAALPFSPGFGTGRSCGAFASGFLRAADTAMGRSPPDSGASATKLGTAAASAAFEAAFLRAGAAAGPVLRFEAPFFPFFAN